jgi:hypothetical protein
MPDQRGTRPSKPGTATRGGESSYLSCINQLNIIRTQWNQLDKFATREDENQVVDINQLRHLHQDIHKKIQVNSSIKSQLKLAVIQECTREHPTCPGNHGTNTKTNC